MFHFFISANNANDRKKWVSNNYWFKYVTQNVELPRKPVVSGDLLIITHDVRLTSHNSASPTVPVFIILKFSIPET